MPERIAKRLARSGLCSRREAERWIEAGRVVVNGEKITSPALNVSDGDDIFVDGKTLAAKEPTRLFLYHKPVGLVTTHRDPQGRPTVFETLPSHLPRLISVGRLDLNTEGLLLLTNDGQLAETLMSPQTKLPRTYRVRVFGLVDQQQLTALKKGLRTKDRTGAWVTYGPITAELEPGKQGRNKWLRMTIFEGKNREVRQICEHLGLQVNRLIRTNYGPFHLKDLSSSELIEVARTQFEQYLIV